MASLFVNAVGGVVYWLIVARLVPTEDAGDTQALFQAAVFVNFAGNLGLPILLARHAQPESNALANWAVRWRVISAILSGIVFLVAASQSDLLSPLDSLGLLGGSALFITIGTGMALAVLIDVRLTTLRRWGWLVGRMGFAALIRIPLLLLVSTSAITTNLPLWLFVIAAVPVAISGFATAIMLRLGHDHPGRQPSIIPDRRTMIRFSLVNWFGLAATQGPLLIVPLIVAFSVDGATNSPFYIAWNIGAILFLLPQLIGQVTLSETGQTGASSRKLRFSFQAATGLTIAATVAIWIGAGLISSLYGSGYEDIETYAPVLAASCIAWAVTSTGLTALRLSDRHHTLVWLSGAFFIATVGPAMAFTPGHGASAAVWSWFGGNMLAATLTVAAHLRRDFLSPA